MTAIERIAAEESARELWLNARHTAFGFYEALGWQFVGDPSSANSPGFRTARCASGSG